MTKPLNILFTGGYDSTFRLLQAAIIEKAEIQPHYIIDHKRKSRRIELKTMDNILDLLSHSFPEARRRIQEIKFTHRRDIPKTHLREKVPLLRKQMHLGEQYFWLLDYTMLHPTMHFELSIEKYELNGRGISDIFVRNTIDLGSNRHVIDSPDIEGLDAFKNFRFPILHIDKQDMLQIATENKFDHILLSSWSCHTPTLFKDRCGVCKPCKQSIEAGLEQLFSSNALKRYKKSHT